jgi:hypothetical protein
MMFMDQLPNEQKSGRLSHRSLVLFRLFFSEPYGGALAWIQFLSFTGGIIGLALIIGHDFITQWGWKLPILLLGGFAIPWCESLAEILPKRYWKLAGIIRIAGWICFIIVTIGAISFNAISR